jgi:NAD(P)-dependent dehydrogenase (short-subunit alcohol dehydrogenase family)
VAKRPAALVTGGSRGIGAATVLALARRGHDVALTFHNKHSRADEVAAAARRCGARALTIGGDMTLPTDQATLVQRLCAWTGRLDALVLNASGGLERDRLAADPDYALHINRDAQLALVDRLLPLLPDGSTLVFVTSHWAHLYGRVEQLPGYEPVARSKHAGEQALRERQAEFAAAGVRLLIVSGDLVSGTITPRLLERAAPGLSAARREQTGALPSAEEMGEAIARAVTDRTLPSGATIVVGGSLDGLLSS